MEHSILRMLRCISNDPSACFLTTTFSQLGLQTFQHVIAVRCSVRILTAHQQDSLKEHTSDGGQRQLIISNEDASDGGQKLRTEIPTRRVDDYCFQTAAPSI